jgi:hypothetical protein
MISETQSGFIEKKSTNTATYTFTENIKKALYQKLLVIVIFLYLTKAFDVINQKLLAELEQYGLRGKIHSWMSSYITGRNQFAEIQQHIPLLKTLRKHYIKS